MIRRTLKWSTWLIIVFIAINGLLGVITNVSTHPTDSDDAVFRTVLGLQKPQGSMTYEQELQIIGALQTLALKDALGMQGIPDYESRESEYLDLSHWSIRGLYSKRVQFCHIFLTLS